MSKFYPVTSLAVILIVTSGCAQFTTSDAELANLKSVADTRANEYIACLKSEASTVTSSTDAAFISQAVGARCKSSLETYKVAQKDYLASQYMMTKKPLDLAVADLEERGQNELAELLVTRAAEPAVAAEPTSSVAGLTLSGSLTAASAAAVAAATTWNPEQRVYLDCMDEQADKYGRLNESAEAIANVAADRCRTYLTVERRQELQEEGRVQVMGKIMDQRVSGTRR